jgi:hypothetical protein
MPLSKDRNELLTVCKIANLHGCATVLPTRRSSATAGESEPFLRLLFTRAPKQDDTKKERHDEWDSRDSDDKTGTGVPRRRERSRLRIVETSDHEEQQRDPIHDHERASCLAPEPSDSTEGSRKRSVAR